jgi:hypothetical protein
MRTATMYTRHTCQEHDAHARWARAQRCQRKVDERAERVDAVELGRGSGLAVPRLKVLVLNERVEDIRARQVRRRLRVYR